MPRAKRKSEERGFETKREALEYERQKKLNNSRSMDMKLSEFMEVYFEDKQNELKERTMKNKRYAYCKKFIYTDVEAAKFERQN